MHTTWRSGPSRRRPAAAEAGATLEAAQETEKLGYDFDREEEKEIDADAVFAKLKSLKSDRKDDEEDDY